MAWTMNGSQLFDWEGGASVAGCGGGVNGGAVSPGQRAGVVPHQRQGCADEGCWVDMPTPRSVSGWSRATRTPQGYSDRYPPDVIVLTHSWRKASVLWWRGWSVVDLDDWAIVMGPQRPDTASLIECIGYQWLKSWEKVPITPANASQGLEERSIRQCPQGANAASAPQVNALQALGGHAEAREAFRQHPARLASHSHEERCVVIIPAPLMSTAIPSPPRTISWQGSRETRALEDGRRY